MNNIKHIIADLLIKKCIDKDITREENYYLNELKTKYPAEYRFVRSNYI